MGDREILTGLRDVALASPLFAGAPLVVDWVPEVALIAKALQTSSLRRLGCSALASAVRRRRSAATEEAETS